MRFPRTLFTLFVRLPRTLWDLITGRRPLTYSFKRERHIRVIRAPNEKGEQTVQRFGLRDDMYYSGPMYTGHIHTVLGGARLGKRVSYERELFPAEDGNPICLDWKKTTKPAKGIAFVVPGLGNYGQTPYVQRLAENLTENGIHVCIFTVRGMGSAPMKVAKFTSVTFTADVRWLMNKYLTKELLTKRFGEDLDVVAVGYSAGGSVVCKAIAEEHMEGHSLPFKGAVCFSAPYDMPTHSASMLTFLGRILYQRPLIAALRKFAMKHKEVLLKGVEGLPKTDESQYEENLNKLKTLQDFEKACIVPNFGYPSIEDYYKDGNSFQWLRKFPPSLPTVCSATRDDIITGYGCTDADWQQLTNSCPNIIYVEIPTGGHLGNVGSVLEEKCTGKNSYLQTYVLDRLLAFFES